MKKLFVLFLFFGSSAFAKAQLESKDFASVLDKAVETSLKCGISQTLVIFDIDNTLLKMNQDLGSDTWFNWQVGLMNSNPNSPELVGKSLTDLLKVQGILYGLSSMSVVELQVPGIVTTVQTMGFPAFALTSRGHEFRDATLRELKKNNIDFSSSAIGPRNGYAGPYKAYELSKSEKFGISSDEAKEWKLSEAKDVVYEQGVFFGSGQHKGAMLRTLLAKTGFQACGVILIDDTPKNTERMWAAFEKTPVDITVIRYSHLDPWVNQFMASDKSHVVRDWNLLKNTLTNVFH